MKKGWVLFVFPCIFAFCLCVSGKNFANKIAHLALWASSPSAAMEYNGIDSEVQNNPFGNFLPHNSPEQSYENPFEDFDIQSVKPTPTPFVPDYDHPITEICYTPTPNDITYKKENCYVKNLTDYNRSDVESQLLAQVDFKVEKNSELPQILIMHTHATESYQNHPEPYYDPEYSCRDTDTGKNMVSVGAIIAEQLNKLGYNTLHDATLHDYPSYNASYGRSKATVEQYLEKYPSIKIVLDVHRDAIERSDGTRVKPTVTINGKKYAQVMIICGADNGYLNMPNFRKNLRFASHLQNSMETLYPGFTRPILFDYRNYNQQLTTGSLLIEVGGHANTLEEAHNSAEAIAYALANALDNMG